MRVNSCCSPPTSMFTGINNASTRLSLAPPDVLWPVVFRQDVDVLHRTVLILTGVVFPRNEPEAKANTMTLSGGPVCGACGEVVRKKRRLVFGHAVCTLFDNRALGARIRVFEMSLATGRGR